MASPISIDVEVAKAILVIASPTLPTIVEKKEVQVAGFSYL